MKYSKIDQYKIFERVFEDGYRIGLVGYACVCVSWVLQIKELSLTTILTKAIVQTVGNDCGQSLILHWFGFFFSLMKLNLCAVPY